MKKLDQAKKLLGLANRARKVTLGMSGTSNSIKKGQCQLLILTMDISSNTRAKIAAAAEERKVRILTCGSKDEFGQIFGRAEVAIIGVEDAGFARALQEILG
ncbi:MAG: L7Ae/L30e/S12e/Gadd45 family ribosomal protein [bacterium]